jgi:hypothetical protein
MNAIIIMLHVCGAIVALLSGFMAMGFRKGSGLHAAAGTVFSTSMLLVAAAGTYMAVFIKPNKGNVMGGVLVFYLVATGWAIARRRDRKTGIFDWGALLGAFGIAAAAMTWGIQAAASHTSSKDGYPAGMYFFFGSIALLFAFSDVRMIVRGGVFGSQRIARHLCRMSLALLFALVSFYPSRARLFPQWVNDSKLLYVPHVLLIGAMFFWLARVKARKRLPQTKVMETKPAAAIDSEFQRVA